jgi:hypothetical protein
MKTGWILSAEDKQKKEKAFKIVFDDKEQLTEKINAIKKKAKSILIFEPNIPYSEICAENRLLVRCKVNEEITSSKLLNILCDFNPFLVKKENNICLIEIDKDSLNEAKKIIKKLF